MSTAISDGYTVSVVPAAQPNMPSLDAVTMAAQITVPGGSYVSAMAAEPPTSDCSIIIGSMMPSISILLGPFGFLFCLLNVALKLIDCVKAVPDCITQLSPSPLTSALTGLAGAVTCFAKMLPQVSMLYLIYDTLVIILKLLGCVISALESILTIVGELQSALSTAGSDADLKAQINASMEQAKVMGAQTMLTISPLTSIFGIINIFLPVLGQPTVSFSMPDVSGDLSWIRTTLGVLNTLVSTLDPIKNALGAVINPP